MRGEHAKFNYMPPPSVTQNYGAKGGAYYPASTVQTHMTSLHSKACTRKKAYHHGVRRTPFIIEMYCDCTISAPSKSISETFDMF